MVTCVEAGPASGHQALDPPSFMASESPHPHIVQSPELAAWLAGHDLDPESFSPLGGDVSPRTYARVLGRDGSSWILATYPPQLEAAFHRFRRTTELLETEGVRVPGIRHADAETLRMVVEDLGAATLYELPPRPWQSWIGDYLTACDALGRIAAVPAAAVTELNPILDGAALRRELDQTLEVFLLPGKLLAKGLEARLVRLFDQLCATIDEQPRLPCHRDFMVRNLIPTTSGLAVLDHQDLRLGPACYDLASLLNDSVFPPPEVEALILGEELEGEEARLDYRRCAVQRTFKAVGTFAAFGRRGFPRHLPLIPPTLRRGLAQMRQLPEGEALAEELSRALEPALAQPGLAQPTRTDPPSLLDS